MTTMQKQVNACLRRFENELAATLSALVRISTVNPYSGDPAPAGEAAGQVFMARQLRRAGARLSSVPVPRDAYRRAGILGPRDRDWTHRRNLIARFRFGSGPRPVRILLNAHMDTIGVSDFEGDPFSGKRQGDLIRGRGASDCKGGLVAALFAIHALKACKAPLNAEVIVESVVDEECSGSGAGTIANCLAGITANYAILLDGMAGLIYTGCQGIATVEITVRGRAGHGSLGGVSAVDKLLLVKTALDNLAAEFARKKSDCLVNVGAIRAGTAPWTVPNRGWLTANINYSVKDALKSRAAGLGYSGAQIRRDLEQRIRRLSAADPWLRNHPPEILWTKDVPPGRMEDSGKPEASRRLLETAIRCFRQAWGRKPFLGELHAWSDISHLLRLGRMPTVGMGAGEACAAHTATEFNRVSNVRRTAAAVALTILDLAREE